MLVSFEYTFFYWSSPNIWHTKSNWGWLVLHKVYLWLCRTDGNVRWHEVFPPPAGSSCLYIIVQLCTEVPLLTNHLVLFWVYVRMQSTLFNFFEYFFTNALNGHPPFYKKPQVPWWIESHLTSPYKMSFVLSKHSILKILVL